MKIEKLLQTLLTPKLQRAQLLLSCLLSLAMLLALVLQLQEEHSRTQFGQLNPRELSYCELQTCQIVELGGLEVASVRILEQRWATFVEVRFINQGRLSGERELWLELLNPAGEIAEAAKTRLVLKNSGPAIAVFSFQRKPLAFETGTLRLGY